MACRSTVFRRCVAVHSFWRQELGTRTRTVSRGQLMRNKKVHFKTSPRKKTQVSKPLPVFPFSTVATLARKLLIPVKDLHRACAAEFPWWPRTTLRQLRNTSYGSLKGTVLNFEQAKQAAALVGRSIYLEDVARPEVYLNRNNMSDIVERKRGEAFDPFAQELARRPTIVSLLGHVDHGKTTLLDSIRHTEIASMEAGHITQDMYTLPVAIGDETITFLDTPGHEDFMTMRENGAVLSDAMILVVDGCEGVKSQTKEALQLVKEQCLPLFVCVSKLDLPEAKTNLPKVLDQLKELQLEPLNPLFDLQNPLSEPAFDCHSNVEALLSRTKLVNDKLLGAKASFELENAKVENENEASFDRAGTLTELLRDSGYPIVLLPLSAKTGTHVELLKQHLASFARTLAPEADMTDVPFGGVLEATHSQGLGRALRVILFRGKLHVGQHFVAGCLAGQIRSLRQLTASTRPNDQLRTATGGSAYETMSTGLPAWPLEISGLRTFLDGAEHPLPNPGEEFFVGTQQMCEDVAVARAAEEMYWLQPRITNQEEGKKEEEVEQFTTTGEKTSLEGEQREEDPLTLWKLERGDLYEQAADPEISELYEDVDGEDMDAAMKDVAHRKLRKLQREMDLKLYHEQREAKRIALQMAHETGDYSKLIPRDSVPGAGVSLVEEAEKKAREAREYQDLNWGDEGALANEDEFPPQQERLLVKMILKADKAGTLQSLHNFCSKIDQVGDIPVKVQLLEAAVGPVNSFDLTVAKDANAFINCFRTGVQDKKLKKTAKNQQIRVNEFSVLYDLMGLLEAQLAFIRELPELERRQRRGKPAPPVPTDAGW